MVSTPKLTIKHWVIFRNYHTSSWDSSWSSPETCRWSLSNFNKPMVNGFTFSGKKTTFSSPSFQGDPATTKQERNLLPPPQKKANTGSTQPQCFYTTKRLGKTSRWKRIVIFCWCKTKVLALTFRGHGTAFTAALPFASELQIGRSPRIPKEFWELGFGVGWILAIWQGKLIFAIAVVVDLFAEDLWILFQILRWCALQTDMTKGSAGRYEYKQRFGTFLWMHFGPIITTLKIADIANVNSQQEQRTIFGLQKLPPRKLTCHVTYKGTISKGGQSSNQHFPP